MAIPTYPNSIKRTNLCRKLSWVCQKFTGCYAFKQRVKRHVRCSSDRSLPAPEIFIHDARNVGVPDNNVVVNQWTHERRYIDVSWRRCHLKLCEGPDCWPGCSSRWCRSCGRNGEGNSENLGSRAKPWWSESLEKVQKGYISGGFQFEFHADFMY